MQSAILLQMPLDRPTTLHQQRLQVACCFVELRDRLEGWGATAGFVLVVHFLQNRAATLYLLIALRPGIPGRRSIPEPDPLRMTHYNY